MLRFPDRWRTRIRFFGAIDSVDAVDLADSVRAGFEREVEIALERQKQAMADDLPYALLMARGAELMASARLDWLREVREYLANASDDAH